MFLYGGGGTLNLDLLTIAYWIYERLKKWPEK